MITAVVTAIAITHREARREKAAKEAEEAEARKKAILVVGAGLAGLLAGLLCRAQGFTVTVVDAAASEQVLRDGDGAAAGAAGIEWLGPNALRVLDRVGDDGELGRELRETACQTPVVPLLFSCLFFSFLFFFFFFFFLFFSRR